MHNFYAIAIGRGRYKVKAHFKCASLIEAAPQLAQYWGQSHGLVLRDGSTGKRYTVGDCQKLTGSK